MANEILKRDDNRIVVLGGVTDDANQFITNLRVDPATNRLKVSAILATGSGISSLNGLTGTSQIFATAVGGADFNISSSGTVHTFQLPVASGTATGKLQSSDWTVFNNKLGTAVTSINGLSQGALQFATAVGGNLSITQSGTTILLTDRSIGTAVTSINGLAQGALQFATATGGFISITQSGTTITLTDRGIGTAIVSLNGLTAGAQSFATAVGGILSIVSSGSTHTISSTAVTSINALTAGGQIMITGSTGTDFTITSNGSTHIFAIPSSSSSNRGLLTSTDWSTFNSKLGTAITSLNGITAGSQSFATATSSYVSITSSGTTHTFNKTGTVSVVDGGTGLGAATAFAVILGGATSTSPLQTVSGLGNATQVLTSNGAGQAPTWQAAAAAGGSSFWNTVPGTPTFVNANTFTITDAGLTNDYYDLISRGTIIRWTQGSGTSMAMVTSGTASAGSARITIMGDNLQSTFSTMKYGIEKARVINFAIAGTLATGSALAGNYYAPFDMQPFAAQAFVNIAGTTNMTSFDLYSNGVTIMTNRPSIGSGTSTGTTFACIGTTTIGEGAKVTVDINAVSTSAPTDAYILLYTTPRKNIFLT